MNPPWMENGIHPEIPFLETDEEFLFSPVINPISQHPPSLLDIDHLLISTPPPPPQDQYPINNGFADNTPNGNMPQLVNIPVDCNYGNKWIGEKKKIIHRDVERQRRQEMAALHSSLRSHLPIEYLKGKRSAADQMNEAVKYIKHLEKKIKELKAKKDDIQRRNNHVESSSDHGRTDIHPPMKHIPLSGQRDSVTVKVGGSTGVEVVINTDADQGLHLWKVMEVLSREGLSISGCNSTRVNGSRLLHWIQCEFTSSGSRADACQLERKIKDSKV